MRNTDMVTFVGYSKGGNGVYGDFGVKVRFAIDKVRRSKELQKLGATEVWFVALPKPMTKIEAVQYLEKHNDPKLSDTVIRDAIASAQKRLVPAIKTTK